MSLRLRSSDDGSVLVRESVLELPYLAAALGSRVCVRAVAQSYYILVALAQIIANASGARGRFPMVSDVTSMMRYSFVDIDTDPWLRCTNGRRMLGSVPMSSRIKS